jgi:hypothetical protein
MHLRFTNHTHTGVLSAHTQCDLTGQKDSARRLNEQDPLAKSMFLKLAWMFLNEPRRHQKLSKQLKWVEFDSLHVLPARRHGCR